jgi:hypothetical protein
MAEQEMIFEAAIQEKVTSHAIGDVGIKALNQGKKFIQKDQGIH